MVARRDPVRRGRGPLAVRPRQRDGDADGAGHRARPTRRAGRAAGARADRAAAARAGRAADRRRGGERLRAIVAEAGVPLAGRWPPVDRGPDGPRPCQPGRGPTGAEQARAARCRLPRPCPAWPRPDRPPRPLAPGEPLIPAQRAAEARPPRRRSRLLSCWSPGCSLARARRRSASPPLWCCATTSRRSRRARRWPAAPARRGDRRGRRRIGRLQPGRLRQPGTPRTCRAPRCRARQVRRGEWALYPGWSYFTDAGFTSRAGRLDLPRPIGTTICFRDPGSLRILSIDPARSPHGDPVQACRKEVEPAAGRRRPAGLHRSSGSTRRPAWPGPRTGSTVRRSATASGCTRSPGGSPRTTARRTRIGLMTRDLDWPGNFEKWAT